jgi:prepilin-type processing-associated H-X9-DG protein
MSGENCEQSPAGSLPARRNLLGCGGCVWTAAGVLFLLVVIALLLPLYSSAPGAARWVQCSNNLKRIYMAMSSYVAKYGCYPPAYSVDKQGRPMHSWRVLLIEFLDPDLYAQYDFSEPWNSSKNMTVARKMEDRGPYYCPGDFDRGQCDTSYVMLVGANAISDGRTARKRKEITDDPHTTIIVVEMSHSGICWTEPRDLNVSEMSFKTEDPSRPCMRSAHQSPGVVNVLFADGSVSAVFPDSLPSGLLKALTTVNGGEDVTKFDTE